jgi:hypothetical protein
MNLSVAESSKRFDAIVNILCRALSIQEGIILTSRMRHQPCPFRSRTCGRSVLLRYAHGLGIVSQIAIDEDWSALRLKRVK